MEPGPVKAYSGYSLGVALAREGLIPPECAEVSLLMPVDGVVQLKYTVNVTSADLPKLARALLALDGKPLDSTFSDPESSHG